VDLGREGLCGDICEPPGSGMVFGVRAGPEERGYGTACLFEVATGKLARSRPLDSGVLAFLDGGAKAVTTSGVVEVMGLVG